MKKLKIHTKLILVIIHLIIGAFLSNKFVALLYGQSIIILGILNIIFNKNNNNEVLKWSMYVVGLEVLMRMTSGFIFSEFGKYAILLFILTGFMVDIKKHPLFKPYLIYILLLLISIVFMPQYYDINKIRQEIAFNLSGPILLGLASIFYYNRKINFSNLSNAFKFSIYPIISMLAYLFFNTPSLQEVIFKSAANFDLTAGFGPNQVATIIGFGIFISTILILLKKYISGFLVLDIIILLYMIYRGLLTFSRGGIIAAMVGIFIFFFYYIRSQKKSFQVLIKSFIFILVIGTTVFFYVSNSTNNILKYRYTGKNTFGDEKEDKLSGRLSYFDLELQAFIEHPFFGVGPGGSKYYRSLHTDRYIGSSHNEFSRLLSEHGIIGVFSIILLFIIPIFKIQKKQYKEKAFLYAFFLFWFLTINHSAMRIAFPAFIYGLTLININYNEENIIYR